MQGRAGPVSGPSRLPKTYPSGSTSSTISPRAGSPPLDLAGAVKESLHMRGLRRAFRRAAVVGLAACAFGLICSSAAQAVPSDRVVLSGTVDVPRGESVDDVVIADGPASVSGTVRGDLVALHGRVFIGGRVRGDVVALSSNAVRLGPGARIGGDLLYRGAKPATADQVVAGETNKVNVDKITGGLGIATVA